MIYIFISISAFLLGFLSKIVVEKITKRNRKTVTVKSSKFLDL